MSSQATRASAASRQEFNEAHGYLVEDADLQLIAWARPDEIASLVGSLRAAGSQLVIVATGDAEGLDGNPIGSHLVAHERCGPVDLMRHLLSEHAQAPSSRRSPFSNSSRTSATVCRCVALCDRPTSFFPAFLLGPRLQRLWRSFAMASSSVSARPPQSGLPERADQQSTTCASSQRCAFSMASTPATSIKR